jgi:hypothetical protein
LLSVGGSINTKSKFESAWGWCALRRTTHSIMHAVFTSARRRCLQTGVTSAGSVQGIIGHVLGQAVHNHVSSLFTSRDGGMTWTYARVAAAPMLLNCAIE